MVSLAEFLSDDLGRGLRIQEAMADDLADDFVGAPVIGLGAGGFTVQSQGAVFFEQMEQLEIAGFGIAEFFGGLGGTGAFALAFEEHGQLEGEFIVGGDGQ